MLEPLGFPAAQACWSRLVLPPPMTLLDPAVVPSIRQLLLVSVHAGDPRSGNLATHLLPPGNGLRLIGSPHRHLGAWHTFHMGRLKGVPFGSLDRRPLYSWALCGCSSVMCTSFQPLDMDLL
ncbi:hypothetical protein SLEP1_g47946 [Rubroshorea leprosula]|uniref:Uncharacterized protein n=1 Tax=Rubroshorea leprosula TaxID=152421 RepID=A0AAV5LS78_9ROSI|nr:hypothetical protein SLEP1_g47946 [Rubroshorea leprosula]